MTAGIPTEWGRDADPKVGRGAILEENPRNEQGRVPMEGLQGGPDPPSDQEGHDYRRPMPSEWPRDPEGM